MGSGIKRWHEDYEEYLALCRQYGEEPCGMYHDSRQQAHERELRSRNPAPAAKEDGHE